MNSVTIAYSKCRELLVSSCDDFTTKFPSLYYDSIYEIRLKINKSYGTSQLLIYSVIVNVL